MRSVSLAEALYVNEGTVSPSSLHSALHSLSPTSLPSSPRCLICLLRVVHRVRGLMSSSLTSPQLTSLSLSVTVSVACPNGSQWVPMGLNGPAGPLSACKRSSSLQALSSRSSTLSSCSPSSTTLRVFIHPNGPNGPTCPTGPAGTLSTLHSPQDHSSSLQWSLRAL